MRLMRRARGGRRVIVLGGLGLLGVLWLPATALAVTETFAFTGAQQQFVVPAGVSSLRIEACGGQGAGNFGSPGDGLGGCMTATLPVAGGETLAVLVGGAGSGPEAGSGGGFNGGAQGGTASAYANNAGSGGGGGGASDVRSGGTALVNRVIVGGGKGGAGGGAGGLGGGPIGGAGGSGLFAPGGQGGTQTSGGSTGGNALPGQLGLGGAGADHDVTGAGGGGGGGLFGGGGGAHGSADPIYPSAGGGGGGSSYADASATDVVDHQGVREGDGRVRITYTAAPTLTTKSSPDVILGGSIHDTATLAGGVDPSGTITFALYAPNDPGCSGPAAFTDSVAVSGNGAYASSPFTPTETGAYRWVASYSGDADNAPASGNCGAASETVSVGVPPPEITALRLDPRRFRATGKDTPLGSAAKAGAPHGSRIRITLSAAATVRFHVRRKGAPAPTCRPCKRHGFSRQLKAGRSSFRFTAKLYGKRLRPGRYRLRARAVNAEGGSRPAQAAFRVVR